MERGQFISMTCLNIELAYIILGHKLALDILREKKYKAEKYLFCRVVAKIPANI